MTKRKSRVYGVTAPADQCVALFDANADKRQTVLFMAGGWRTLVKQSDIITVSRSLGDGSNQIIDVGYVRVTHVLAEAEGIDPSCTAFSVRPLTVAEEGEIPPKREAV